MYQDWARKREAYDEWEELRDAVRFTLFFLQNMTSPVFPILNLYFCKA